jgi:ubiquinone biosynthesis protein UbiJ
MAASPTVQTALLAALERVLNQALALDPESHRALGQLEGRVFALNCTAPSFQAYLMPGIDGVQLAGRWDGEVTTRVSGKASDFAEVATADDPAAALINGGLTLEGNSSALLELQRILAALDLDWEAPLVEHLGDVTGHQLAEGLRGLFSFGRQARASLERQLDEFIHEEARLSPPRQELEDFFADVGQLAERSERLASRIERLKQRLRRLQQ